MKLLLVKAALSLFLVATMAATVLTQDDSDPNSPLPALERSADATRVMAISVPRWRGRFPMAGERVFWPGASSRIVIFVSGVETQENEGANAFRVYVRQQSGKTFEMETETIMPIGKSRIAITLRLYDRSGFRGQPVADGDSIIYATWRGLSSEKLLIGFGSTKSTSVSKSVSTPEKASPPQSADYVGYQFSGDRTRLMEQATFGPSAAVDSRIRRIGLRTWLNDQFETPYPTFPYPDVPQMPLNPPADCQLVTFPSCYRERYTMSPLQKWFFVEAMYGNAQLRHRVAWTLSQIFVTSGASVSQSSHEIAFQKILARNAFGNFRDLLYDVTLSPTMGFYLDMARSTRENPNENYPREILQLFSIGLYKLNIDGTLQLDAQGNPIPTYNQETINNFSKVFTGWSFCNQGCASSRPGIVNYRDPMTLTPANHDLTAKSLLSYPGSVAESIPACEDCASDAAKAIYATASLNGAIDNIFNHPNVGPYISRLLIQQMVTSDPSPAYVARVASTFNNNGANVRGDMRAVIKAILLDPEARGDFKNAPRYGKLREPVQLITTLARLFPARDYAGESISDGALAGYVANLGQNPFYSPTVFNYFSPSYIVPGTTLNAPEFELLNTGTAVKRTNLLSVLIFDGLTANATDSLRGTSLDFSAMMPAAQADPTGNQLIDALNVKMLHSTLSPAQRTALQSAVAAVPASNSLLRIKTAVYLIAASSQFQVQR